MTDDEITPPEPPIMRKSYDLTNIPEQSKNPPVTDKTRADFRSPAAMMRNMGFDPTSNMDPLQFLVAVLNDRTDLIYKSERKRQIVDGKGGLSIVHRVNAAITAAKFMHMQMPRVEIQQNTDGDYGKSLAKAVASGNERVRTKRVILETVERVSPDFPLPQASYPEAFDPEAKPPGEPEPINGVIIEVEGISPEGDTDYDPDADD